MDKQAKPNLDLESQRIRSALLDGMLLVAAVIGLPLLVVNHFSLEAGLSQAEWVAAMVPFIAGWLIAVATLALRGLLSYRVRAWIPIAVVYSLGFYVFWRGALAGSGSVWMLLLPPLAFVLLGPRAGLWAGVVSVLTYGLFAFIFTLGGVPVPEVQDPSLLDTWQSEGTSFLLVVAIITLTLRAFSQRWLDALANAAAVNEELEARSRELEEKNAQLGRRSSQLQATVEIARAGSTILEPDELMAEVVNQIQDGFGPMGVYYVGLFLVGEDGRDAVDADTGQQFAMLRAATGEAGKLLLEIGHKLPLDETSMIGWCVTHEQARIALDVGEDPVWFGHPILEPTRSEIALPLSSRGRVLGALSVQSSRERAFDEADIAVLQAMADHVAAAVDNVRLFRRTEKALQEMEAVQQRYLERGWRKLLRLTPQARVDYMQPGAEPAGDGQFLHEARRAAVVHQRTVAANAPHPSAGRQREGTASVPQAPPEARPGGSTEPLDQASGRGSAEVSPESGSGQAALVVPLKLWGQVVGTMALHETRRDRPWTADEIGLAETIAEQVVQTVENLRLMDEAQRSAARERGAREIADQMQRAADMETLMRIAAEELNRALGGSRTYVRLGVGASPRFAVGGEQGEGDD